MAAGLRDVRPGAPALRPSEDLQTGRGPVSLGTVIGDLVAALKPRRHILRPIAAARVLTGRRRSPAADLALATVLAGVAGASNAGGFFALGAYTSHMTGYLSQLAD
ncbi:hypothetical protein KTN05_16635, partial [Paracoccus sp. Z118]|nr:hypothetical protein [Paracoccus sp. Z118]